MWFSFLGIGLQAQYLADGDNVSQKLISLDSNSLHTSLAFWLSFNPDMDSTQKMEIQQQVTDFCDLLVLKRTKFKTEENFLWYAFNRVHHDFLQCYEVNTPFYKIFKSKSYNCVTGSAFFALVFKQLGYIISIRETASHAYLVIQLEKGRIMIESTDPQNGFITNQKIIWKKEKALAENANRALIHEISLMNLCGLQFYNQAVKLFYSKHYSEANMLLEKGMAFYPASSKIWYLHRKISGLQMSYSHAGL